MAPCLNGFVGNAVRVMAALSVGAALSAGVAGASDAPPATGRIEATLSGVRNLGKGALICLLYREVSRIDADPRLAWKVQREPADAHAKTIVFSGLPPGEYAIAVVHDMDGNGRLTSNFLGMPTEDLAVSRNAKGGPLGGPRWAEAKVRLQGPLLQTGPMRVKHFYD